MISEVQDLAHFAGLQKKVKARLVSFTSNCYLLPQEITKLTKRHDLFFQENDQGLFIFQRKPDFYSLFFFIKTDAGDEENIEIPSLDKPIILDLTYSDINISNKSFSQDQYWQQMGFIFYKRYKQMVCFPSRRENRLELLNDRYIIDFADKIEASVIQRLWRRTLDPYSTALPEIDEIEEMIEKQEVIVCRTKNQKLAAAILVDKTGKSASIDHVVVDANFRMKGLGKVLLSAAISLAEEINKFILWVDENNVPAIALYVKQGFVFSGKISDQFLFQS